MRRFYNPDDYFLVQNIVTNEVYAVLTIYKVKFKADRNDGLFPCYHFSALGLVADGVRNFLPREQLYAYEEVVKKALG